MQGIRPDKPEHQVCRVRPVLEVPGYHLALTYYVEYVSTAEAPLEHAPDRVTCKDYPLEVLLQGAFRCWETGRTYASLLR